jgi:hypothetical protein
MPMVLIVGMVAPGAVETDTLQQAVGGKRAATRLLAPSFMTSAYELDRRAP